MKASEKRVQKMGGQTKQVGNPFLRGVVFEINHCVNEWVDTVWEEMGDECLRDFDEALPKQLFVPSERLQEMLTKCLVVACAERDVGKDVQEVLQALPQVVDLVRSDVRAAMEGDPAARDVQEVVLGYPGIFAVAVQRVAHCLHQLRIPLLPRLMTEYAHAKTGIDIHPGAEIGKGFFIDHGTGVVIGETTVLGEHCKIYHNVTLGALSTHNASALVGKKRHPTIGNGVTIYCGAVVLGGDTVVGDGAVIGCNTVVTKSVAKGAKVKSLCTAYSKD
ncbi:MAG: serine O-acetyltransferase [Firmicutes bacterium]|nr:serine O-acetyltransferase [Bacillota bacterium]